MPNWLFFKWESYRDGHPAITQHSSFIFIVSHSAFVLEHRHDNVKCESMKQSLAAIHHSEKKKNNKDARKWRRNDGKSRFLIQCNQCGILKGRHDQQALVTFRPDHTYVCRRAQAGVYAPCACRASWGMVVCMYKDTVSHIEALFRNELSYWAYWVSYWANEPRTFHYISFLIFPLQDFSYPHTKEWLAGRKCVGF